MDEAEYLNKLQSELMFVSKCLRGLEEKYKPKILEENKPKKEKK